MEDGNSKDAIELLGQARFRIFDAMVEKDGFAFIAVGRPESEGCYCKVNSYLKEVISILSSEFDYVVIDGEAGIEQINRRVMDKVSHLVLVTDPSRKGTQVIQTIKNVADKLVMFDEAGVIVNRLSDRTHATYIDVGDIPVLSFIEDDHNLALFDVQGKNVFSLPDHSNVVVGTTEALKKMKIL